MSTLTHYICLYLIIFLGASVWAANVLAFSIAFIVSFILQQRFTFSDRLQGKRLNALAALIIFAANIIAAGVLGLFADLEFSFLLPLAPAAINYSLYYLFSGLEWAKSCD